LPLISASKRVDTRKIIMADCVEPACHSKMDMFKSNVLSGKKKDSIKPSLDTTTTQQATQPPKDCPLDRDELGNATWGLVSNA